MTSAAIEADRAAAEADGARAALLALAAELESCAAEHAANWPRDPAAALQRAARMARGRAEPHALAAAVDGPRTRVAFLERKLGEVLSTFQQHGHPGYPAMRSYWVDEDRVAGWWRVLRGPR